MKFNKKMLSLALAFAMVLSCMPGAALVTAAAETAVTYDRPTGRSIVVNYDGYMESVGKDWAEELLGTLAATATIGGEGEYAITWPSADEVKSIIDPDKVGYYSIPGSVGGVSNAVSATVQVCEATNLFYNPSFEGSTTGWAANYWAAPANSAAGYTSVGLRGPAAVGDYAFGMASNANANTSYGIFRTKEGSYETDLAAKVKELGAGQYYLSAQARDYDETAGGTVTEGTNSGPFSVNLSLYEAEENSTTFTFVAQTTAVPISKTAYATTGGVVELDGDAGSLRVIMNLKSDTAFSAEYILADDMQFFPLNVSLQEEPAHIAAVNTEIPARAIAKNYDTYVGENWKEALGLPATVEVTTDSGATATANVTWDCSNVDFTQLGKQTITGTLTGDALLNSKGLTVKQNIYVNEVENLFTNAGFETAYAANWSGRYNQSWKATPAVEGNYAIGVQSSAGGSWGTNYPVLHSTNSGKTNVENTNDIATKVAAIGAGQYFVGAKVMDYVNGEEETHVDPMSAFIRLSYNDDGSTAWTKIGDSAQVVLNHDDYQIVGGTFELSATEKSFYTELYLASTSQFYGQWVLVDDMQFFPLNVEIAEPAFSGAACVLDNSLALRFNAPADQFGGDFTDPYVVFNFKDKEVTVTEYTETTDGKYAFAFTNIAPHQIAETVTATLYATYGGKVVAVDKQQYSVKKYCDTALADTTASTELKTLLADMLNYCAAVQTFKGQTDLVNAELDPTLATQTDPALEDHLNVKAVELPGATAAWVGASLVLEDAVTIRLRFKADSIENVTVKITTDTQEWTVSEFVAKGDGTYYADFNGLHAAQMRKVINATVYSGDTAISNTVAYSVESYAYYAQNITENSLGALVKAMMKYGDSAVAYANAQ